MFMVYGAKRTADKENLSLITGRIKKTILKNCLGTLKFSTLTEFAMFKPQISFMGEKIVDAYEIGKGLKNKFKS